MDAGPCAVNLRRYYYDSTNQSCKPFTYGGCSGNSNNFLSTKLCEDFCSRVRGGPVREGHYRLNDENMDTYRLGFSLTGPLLRDKHQPDIKEQVSRLVVIFSFR